LVLEPFLLTWNLQIIASDFSSKMVARARQGCYSPLECDRGLPIELRDKYFQRQGDNWQIQAEIHQMVEIHQITIIIQQPKFALHKDLMSKLLSSIHPFGKPRDFSHSKSKKSTGNLIKCDRAITRH
jgi:hypothetical protein